MGEHDDALREIADARARMSVLADELGRRANPELMKARARELVLEKKDEVKEHAKQLAHDKSEELKQQARDKVLEWKSQARETAMRKTYDWTDEVTHTPRGLGWLGAVLGAGVGSMLMKRAFRSRIDERRGYREHRRVPVSYAREDRYLAYEDERGYRSREGSRSIPYSEYSAAPSAGGTTGVGQGYGYVAEDARGEGPSMKDRAVSAKDSVKDSLSGATDSVKEHVAGAADTVRERVHGVKDNVSERASHLREHIPSAGDLRHRSSDFFGRALEEQPLALALGAVALGMLAASLLPVSNKERQLIEPAKRRAQEGISQLGEQVGQKLDGSQERQDESPVGEVALAGPIAGGVAAGIPSLPPLDDVSKVH
ncbi:hypothetical protein SAMN05443572_10787 [Myxococcus fulvus]|uniref:DUF3618 domain-containing protein n=1 Tax=Myxococcus fulvus TaxID=33 RepID=A0A511TA00_MYXFU|nr:hypothetical protein [Myxococcus fulvus]GEN10008.1 hypothetical protein MFU01_50450 [Myxococcus fulvus]SEU25353.1 hypothetical protein SAMN05443572_10787 [Myxococcus fulvus]